MTIQKIHKIIAAEKTVFIFLIYSTFRAAASTDFFGAFLATFSPMIRRLPCQTRQKGKNGAEICKKRGKRVSFSKNREIFAKNEGEKGTNGPSGTSGTVF